MPPYLRELGRPPKLERRGNLSSRAQWSERQGHREQAPARHTSTKTSAIHGESAEGWMQKSPRLGAAPSARAEPLGLTLVLPAAACKRSAKPGAGWPPALRLGDPRQTSGGTGPGRLAQEVRAVSDELFLGIRSARQPLLPQELPHLVQTLLIDDPPPGCPVVVPPLTPTVSPPVQIGLTSNMPCCMPSPLMASAGTGPKASTLVLVSLRHMTGVSCCRCHNGSNQGSTRSWP